MAESVRMQQLKKLAGAMPVANQAVATGLKEAQATQFQAAIASAKPGAGVPQAQQLGAAQTAEQGKINLAAAQENQQQAGQVANVMQAQAGTEAQQRVGTQERAVAAQNRGYEQRLSALSNNLKNELVDKELTFTRNQAGQAVLNERQLADYAILSSKNQAEFEAKKQQAEQLYQKKVQFYETVAKKLENAAKAGYTAEGKKLDFESKKRMMENAQMMKDKARREANEAAAKKAKWAAGGTIVGAIIGGVIGGPTGASTGGSIGGGMGGLMGGG